MLWDTQHKRDFTGINDDLTCSAAIRTSGSRFFINISRLFDDLYEINVISNNVTITHHADLDIELPM
jgi:hypothetical protein